MLGGRYCLLAAGDAEEPVPCLGLLLLGYPLHPAGKPERERAEHFARLHVPLLFVSGTRDALAGKPALTKAARRVKGPVTFRWLDTADHGFRPLKSSGHTIDEIVEGVAASAVSWVEGLPG